MKKASILILGLALVFLPAALEEIYIMPTRSI